MKNTRYVCHKFNIVENIPHNHEESSDTISYIFDREIKNIISDTKQLVRICLQCKKFLKSWCQISSDLVRILTTQEGELQERK